MHKRPGGFSLVELLVVVAIMAVVAGMMLTTMRAVWKVVQGWRAEAPAVAMTLA